MKKLVIFIAVVLGLTAANITFQRFGQNDRNAVLGTNTEARKSDKILYVSNQTGNQEIYLRDLNTKKSTNLTNNPSEDMNPQVSPDSKYIIFYSNRDGDNDIYRMRLKDQEVIQLTHNRAEDYDPIYSHDGKSITYKSTADDQQGDIFLMRADGTNIRNLTQLRKDTEEWDPTFAQDDKRIIFVIRRDQEPMTDELGSIRLDGSDLTQLTRNDVPDWYPAIHPHKNWLAFIAKTDPKNPDDIYMSTLDGASRTQLTSLPGNDADPAWNPSGDTIVFINDQDGDYDIYLMNKDGSNPRKLFDTSTNELSPLFL